MNLTAIASYLGTHTCIQTLSSSMHEETHSSVQSTGNNPNKEQKQKKKQKKVLIERCDGDNLYRRILQNIIEYIQ